MRKDALFVLKNAQYENCQVVSPDGDLMFRTSCRRGRWYLNRKLAEVVNENPLVIRLTFTPKGKGYFGDSYFLQEMKNVCVVCGSESYLTRHHVVPHWYRRFFPIEYKQHKSYDVLPICTECHYKYEQVANTFKKELAEEYGVPLSGIGEEQHKGLIRISGIAWTLKNSDKIPLDRRRLLLEEIENFLGHKATQEDLESLINKDKMNSSFTPHGKGIVEKVTDIDEFIKKWRRHFVQKMQPQFLPNQWSVEGPTCYR